MALKDIDKIIRADRYTQDGRDEVCKAIEKETEDRTYNIGEISQKTGLQKTANGWVEPKKARAGAGKAESKPGRDRPLLKKEDHVKLAKEVISNTMPGGSEWSAEDIAKEWKLGKADAEEVKKAMQAVKIDEGVKKIEARRGQAQKIQKGVENYLSKKNAAESSSDKWQKTKDYLDRERISMKTPQGGMVSIYETDNPNQKNNRFRVDTGSHADYFNTIEEAKAFAEKYHGPDSKLKSEPGPDRDDSPERAEYERQLSAQQAQRAADDPRGYGYEEPPMEPAAESKPANTEWETKGKSPKTESKPKPSFDSYVEAIRKRDKFLDTYEKQKEEYDVGQRLRANGGGAILDPLYGLKPNDYEKDPEYIKAMETIKAYENTSDCAPRKLTGDCKVKVRKG